MCFYRFGGDIKSFRDLFASETMTDQGSDLLLTRSKHLPTLPILFHLFALLDGGVGDWHPKFAY